MSFKIVPTPPFERELRQLAKKYPSVKKDIAELGEKLLQNPTTGTPLGHDCYKIRLAVTSRARGKSGGARVITHVHVAGENIFLLSIYDKSQAESISDKDLLGRLKNL